MVKNIKNSSSSSSKNIRNDDSLKLSTMKVTDATIINANITNLTNTELQTATIDISTLQTDVNDLENSKQDLLTSGESITTGNITIDQPGATNVTFNMKNTTSEDRFRMVYNTDSNKVFFQMADDGGSFSTIYTIENSDFTFTQQVDVNSNDMINVNSINSISSSEISFLDGVSSNIQTQLNALTFTAGSGLSFDGTVLNAEVTDFDLDQKQDLLTSGNGIDIVSGLGTTISVDESELTTKQDALTAGNGIDIVSTTISVDESELTTKQDLLTSSTSLSIASINLNNGNLTNANRINVSTINLNGSDLQDKLDDKVNLFGLLQPLELQAGGFPYDAIKLNYNTSQFQLNGSDELEMSGILPTLSSSLDCGNNVISGITSLKCKTIEINNTDLASAHYIDFGSSDFRFRISYNETANETIFKLKDATGLNGEDKLVINYTDVNIENSNLNMNSNDVIGLQSFQSDTNIRFYVDGDTTGSSNYIMNLKANGDIDVNDATLINVEGIESSNYPTTAILRIASFNTPDTNRTSSGSYGSDSYLSSFSTAVGTNLEIEIGASFLSSDDGIFTISSSGTYKISCFISADNASVNDRVVMAFYISINNTNSQWQYLADSFGMVYLRDDNYGQGSSCSFSSIRTLELNDTIRIKTKFGQGNNNWNETRNDNDVDVWANITFEKLF